MASEKNVFVLASGGVDSTVLLAFAHRLGCLAGAVFVNYEQPAALQERRAVVRVCERLSTSLHEVTVRMVHGGLEFGTGYVAGRNTVLLALAANVAGPHGVVWIGCTMDDGKDYPDTRRVYVDGMDAVLREADKVRVEAPLLGMRRDTILRLGCALDIDTSDCWSCHRPDHGEPCGHCYGCARLR